jgi:hypothetical protein
MGLWNYAVAHVFSVSRICRESPLAADAHQDHGGAEAGVGTPAFCLLAKAGSGAGPWRGAGRSPAVLSFFGFWCLMDISH